jgi:hypothetical protein
MNGERSSSSVGSNGDGGEMLTGGGALFSKIAAVANTVKGKLSV